MPDDIATGAMVSRLLKTGFDLVLKADGSASAGYWDGPHYEPFTSIANGTLTEVYDELRERAEGATA